MTVLTALLILVSTVLATIYVWFKYQYSYWKRKNVPYIPPIPILGNLKDIVFMKVSAAESLQQMYHHEIAENQPIVGMHVFHTPALLIREPELIKRILIKDFNKFSNRYSNADPHSDALGSYILFFLKNPLWKLMRTKLSPTFTSGRMKQMFSLVNDVGKQMDAYLCDLTNDSKKQICIELKETCALFTTDVIATAAFGVEANSLKNPNGDFRKNGRKIFDFTVGRAFEFTTLFFLPQLVAIFKSKLFSKESSHFLRSTIDHVMKEREKNGVTRNDLIDTLIALKNDKDKSEITFKDDVLVAQAGSYFIAGFETSSSAMAFGLYEISKKPHIQNRLREEIKNILLASSDGEITYDAIQNMEYLNMILQEILRLYPPLPFLDRECTLTKDDKDGYSLEPFSDFKIPNGMPVYIPIYATQRDPQYFTNPDEFDPERFAPENKTSLLSSVYMPFGTGPHNCIGERFGLMTVKLGLIHFFKNHIVKPSLKSPKTMKLESKALIIQAEGGIHCEIVRDPLIK